MTFPSDRPIVCLITSGESTHPNYTRTSANILDLVAAAVANGLSLVQIREKQLDGRLLFDLVSRAVSLTKGSMTRLLVNGRTDVAVAAGADGVHLPSDTYSPTIAREMAGEDFLIGVSTHRLDEVGAAEKAGADYVVFGPVFDTPGKSPESGIDGLIQAVQSFPNIPILGLGGIDESNFYEVLETGAAGFAAIRYLKEIENVSSVRTAIERCKSVE
jgi:thiamine-phosphate pyrophosphorylase